MSYAHVAILNSLHLIQYKLYVIVKKKNYCLNHVFEISDLIWQFNSVTNATAKLKCKKPFSGCRATSSSLPSSFIHSNCQSFSFCQSLIYLNYHNLLQAVWPMQITIKYVGTIVVCSRY